MADVRADALANTFLIPDRSGLLPQAQRGIAARSGVGSGTPQIPKAVEGLQYVEGTTRDYYDKWANLKNFVNSAWTNFGIDVTKPDFANPEGLRMNEIYTKAVADLMFQGDQLKTSQSELSKILADQRAGKVMLNQDPSQGLVTQTDPRQLTTSTGVDPITEEANEFSKRRFYTSSEFNQANEAYEETKQMWEQSIVNDPENAEYYQRQLDALQPPTKSTKIFAPQREGSSGSGEASGGSLLRKVSNILLGSGETWNRASTIDPLKLQNNDFKGDVYGEYVDDNGKSQKKVIDSFIFDPETKSIEITYQGEVPSDVISSNDALSVARQLVSSNPRYGTLTSLDKYVESNTLLDSEGEVDPSKLVSPKLAKLQEENLKEITELKPFVNKAKSQITDKLKNLGRWLGGGTEVFDIPEEFGGGQIEIQKGFSSGKFFIDNLEQIYPDAKKKDFEKLSAEQIINILTTTGILEAEAQKLKQAGTESVPTNSNTEFDSDI